MAGLAVGPADPQPTGVDESVDLERVGARRQGADGRAWGLFRGLKEAVAREHLIELPQVIEQHLRFV